MSYKKYIRFFKDKLIIMLIILITIGVTAALTISISISSVVVNNTIENDVQMPGIQQKAEQGNLRPLNLAKVEKYKLFYNGQAIEDCNAYIVQKQKNIIPIDAILKMEGSKINYYAADDLASANVFGNNIMFWLGKSIYINNNKIKTTTPPFVYNYNLFTDDSLLSYLPNFQLEVNKENKAIFINNFSAMSNKLPSEILVLSQNKKYLSLTDMEGASIKWETDADTSIVETNVSPDGEVLLVKTIDEVYLVNFRSFNKVTKLNIPITAELSLNGKHLYWWDNKTNLIVYDVISSQMDNAGIFVFDQRESSITRYLDYEPLDLFDQRESSDSSNLSVQNNKAGLLQLNEYSKKKGFLRITLTNPSNDETYTYIERNQKTKKSIIEGNVIFSPDRTKFIYQKTDNSFYSANADGTEKMLLGYGTEAKWINNKSVLIYAQKNLENEKYIVNVKSKLKYTTHAEWQNLGSTPQNDTFYQRDLMLICESKGEGVEVGILPWKCEKISALSPKGPYLLYCKEQDGVFYYEKGMEPKRVGNTNRLYNNTVLLAPDNNTIAILERDVNGFGRVKLVYSKAEYKNITLNIQNANNLKYPPRMKWISRDLLMVYTEEKVWLINAKGKVELKVWSQGKDGMIYFAK